MKILVIEDEKKLSQALVELLKHSNFIVDASYDGEEGEYKALGGEYDLILLDIMLPKKSGLEVLSNLRKEGKQSKILMLTAKSQIEDIVLGLNLGADDYLTKPFSYEELLARVHALTRRKEFIQDDLMKFKDVTFSIKTATLTGQRNQVELGSKEINLIELFFGNINTIVTKEKIIECLWGIDKDAGSNNVEVYISFLRKKLSLISSSVHIRTMRGIGYIFEEND